MHHEVFLACVVDHDCIDLHLCTYYSALHSYQKPVKLVIAAHNYSTCLPCCAPFPELSGGSVLDICFVPLIVISLTSLSLYFRTTILVIRAVLVFLSDGPLALAILILSPICPHQDAQQKSRRSAIFINFFRNTAAIQKKWKCHGDATSNVSFISKCRLYILSVFLVYLR